MDWPLTEGIALLLFLPLALALTPAASAEGESPIQLGSRRELFVDHHLIERLESTTLRMHRPQFAGVVGRVGDFPWERGPYAYTTVLKDRERYRMYYRAAVDSAADRLMRHVTCYAESTDGVHWVKPELGIFEVKGSKKNNVVMTAHCEPTCTHNFAPFIDTRPGVPAAEKYKALAGERPAKGGRGLVPFISPDGIHWKRLVDRAVITDKGWAFDSQNVSFWSESEKCYVCYFRRCPERVRAIARSTSKDFVNWSPTVQMKYGDGGTKPPEDLYLNQTHPYFRAPHIYISLAPRFMKGRQAVSDAQVKELTKDPAIAKWLKSDCSDFVLMTTRGGDRYQRTFMQAFCRPGIGFQNWTSRSNYPACGVVPTGPAEMSLYVTRQYGQPSVHLARYTLRTDGFASVHAPYEGGEMVTKPLLFEGNALEINFSTSAAGGIQVEFQNADGKPIKGFALSDCPEIFGDRIAHVVRFAGGSDMSNLAGKLVRLRFVMKDADLYSIQFRRTEGEAGKVGGMP